MQLETHHFSAPQSPRTPEPPIVLLHGFASSAAADFPERTWIRRLNAEGRSVVTLDLPGHGGSPTIAPSEQLTTTTIIAAILEAIAREIPTGPFDAIGYSLGARLAWELPTASPRVRRLVLGGLSPTDPFASFTPAQLTAALQGAAGGHPIAAAIAGLISAPGQDTASLTRVITGLGTEPFAPEHRAPSVPTLFVTGAADQLTRGVAELTEALPNATLAVVPGDHREALDSPEFTSAALRFLSH